MIYQIFFQSNYFICLRKQHAPQLKTSCFPCTVFLAAVLCELITIITLPGFAWPMIDLARCAVKTRMGLRSGVAGPITVRSLKLRA